MCVNRTVLLHKNICNTRRDTFQSYDVNFTILVLYDKWVLHCRRLWPLLWKHWRLLAGPLEAPTARPLHTHPNIFCPYLIDLLAFVSKGRSCFLPSPSGTFSQESEGESASIDADIGGVLQGETSCDWADVWLSPWWRDIIWNDIEQPQFGTKLLGGLRVWQQPVYGFNPKVL